MLKHLRLHNFRTYLNAEVDFARQHLFIGKNNSGKSNLCAALRFLGNTASRSLGEAASACVPGGISEFTHFSLHNSKTATFSVLCVLPRRQSELRYQYDVSIEVLEPGQELPTGNSSLRVTKETLTVWEGGDETRLIVSDGTRASVLNDESPPVSAGSEVTAPAPSNATMLSGVYESTPVTRVVLFKRFLQRWFYFSFNTESIRWGWKEAMDPYTYYVDGKHVAAAVFQLKNQDDARYRRLIERVRIVEPGLQGIGFLVGPDQGILPFVELKGVRKKITWAGLSDGTLRALALAHLIEAADAAREVEGMPSPMIIVEEPESRIYGGHLRKLLEDFEDCAPQSQFIFTTHSPQFIDLFEHEPASVTLLKRDGDHSVAKRLGGDAGLAQTASQLSLAEKYFAEILE